MQLSPSRGRSLAAALLLGSGASLAGCSGGQVVPSVAGPDLYADFAECGPLPTAIDHDPVPGLVEVAGMVVTDVRRTGQITSVTGLVDATPLQLRDVFEGREDVEVIHVEDEGYEAEVLVGRGEHRTFLKATIRCRTGSVIALVVAPAADADRLPTPGQGR